MNPRFFLPWLFALATGLTVAHPSRGEPPMALKPDDVIAFTGGEDMVAASELGYLECLLVRAFPDHHLKFRCLAWEGDTVFEQPRMLNYPPLEKQLDDIGATVVICQFGQMESLAGEAKLPAFLQAYEKLVERLRGKKRRVIIASATEPAVPPPGAAPADVPVPSPAYWRAIELFAERMQAAVFASGVSGGHSANRMLRDGLHLNPSGHLAWASAFSRHGTDRAPSADDGKLRRLIQEKNSLWFDYYRPQNWAFLAGDRTNQPSSRDFRDPGKRWFPDEMQQFLPLIEAKEREIWALAKQLSHTP